MVSAQQFLEKHSKLIVFGFFAALLLLGINIYRDYGASWDEHIQRLTGIVNWKYIFEGNQALLTYHDRYYGPVFEVVLVGLEKLFKVTDSQAIYYLRHLATFCLFYLGVIFFYKICRLTLNRWWALLGTAFLILSPRIFSHAFYNSKDLPFLSLFIIGIYTLIHLLRRKNFLSAMLHAFVCAILIDIRIVGILLPAMTIGFLIIDLAIEKDLKRFSISFFTYVFFLALFTVLFWPILWADPVGQFSAALKEMSHYPSYGKELYWGEDIASNRLPWHYVPVWVSVTTPLLYVVFFWIGIVFLVRSLFKSPMEFYRTHQKELKYLAWLFVPIITVIALKSILYDAWRQMYFIYPAFLLIALGGAHELYQFISQQRQRKILQRFFWGVVAASSLYITVIMMLYHPFEDIYFNRLAGWNLREARTKFELDYWGLSYRQALEWVLENDTRPVINIAVANAAGGNNVRILSANQQSRIRVIGNVQMADYFLTNFRWHKGDYPLPEVYAIKRGGAKIMAVYKVNP